MSGPTFDLDDGLNDLEQAEELIEEINGLLEGLPDRAELFERSVSETTHDISVYMDKHGRVTKKQINALENMLDGIRRWIRD